MHPNKSERLNFEEIYIEYSNLVFNLALQYVQSKEDAQEIAQDVFLKVYDKFDSFNENSTLKTWIYRITINTSLDFIKAKKRNKRGFFYSALRIDDPEKIVPLPNFEHPGFIMENKEAAEKIFQAINDLPEDQKTALILMRLDQKTQAETAEIMNKTTKAVESLFQRAKMNLNTILNKNEGK